MYQKIYIIGNLGKDPELRFTPTGLPVCNFPVATNRSWYNSNGERQEETVWFRVSVWGRQAEACNSHLSKGSLVHISGRLRPKNPDRKQASYDLTAEDVKFLIIGDMQTDDSDNDELWLDY